MAIEIGSMPLGRMVSSMIMLNEAAWSQYKLNHAQGKTLPERIGKCCSEAIQQNRHYLKTIVEVILLCAKQDLALQGHRESSNSDNRGIF